MLRLAILGDAHYTTAGPSDSGMLLHRSEMILTTALHQIARHDQRPDLIIQLGDLANGEDQTREQARADLDRAIAMFDQTALRWTWIPGNHDVLASGGKRWLLRRLRRTPSYGEVVFGDNVLLLLDSACEEIFGRVDAEQQAWLEQALDLHHRRRIFVFIHHVLDWSFEDDMYIEDGESIRALLLSSPAVKALFMGHAHTPRIETNEGLHEIVTGALNAWPLMFRRVEIGPDRLRVRSEKVAVPAEIEAEALAAHKSHPLPWEGVVRDSDLSAELRFR